MTTQTRNPMSRSRTQTAATSTGRFRRSTPQQTTKSRFGRSAQQPSKSRFPVPRRRKEEPKSGINKALSAVSSALPSGADAKKAASSGKAKVGGVALATAAGAGLAFMNRDKLKSAIGQRGGEESSSASAATGTPAAPATGGLDTTPAAPAPGASSASVGNGPGTAPDPLAGTGTEPLLSEPGPGDLKPDRPPKSD